MCGNFLKTWVYLVSVLVLSETSNKIQKRDFGDFGDFNDLGTVTTTFNAVMYDPYEHSTQYRIYHKRHPRHNHHHHRRRTRSQKKPIYALISCSSNPCDPPELKDQQNKIEVPQVRRADYSVFSTDIDPLISSPDVTLVSRFNIPKYSQQNFLRETQPTLGNPVLPRMSIPFPNLQIDPPYTLEPLQHAYDLTEWLRVTKNLG
ncbi:hypothetical protein HHI36_010471 [Cryptolaemus montrouzieri]|uniref:Uncharacterized protein n=1 Tax=Cryptolaemus montrouzieri TaxID=559131 RepID=A0ABD2MJK3_9CUCU